MQTLRNTANRLRRSSNRFVFSFIHPSKTTTPPSKRFFRATSDQTKNEENSRRMFANPLGVYDSSQRQTAAFFLAAATTAAAAAVVSRKTLLEASAKVDNEVGKSDGTTTVLNWSGTHSVDVLSSNYYEPETIQELERIVADCHANSRPIRPVGSALSPNGIAFQRGGMLSLANLDQIIRIDKDHMTVTVQAGARVSQVIEALRPHGLTLPNLASIAEQQIGGFVQVGAHGTGANIPPVDDFVTSLKLVTPAEGTIELSATKDEQLFHLAKVGLGCLGIVTEVTMKCIPAHDLIEHVYVLSRKDAISRVSTLLQKHKHVRYMWIPYQDAVIVVTNDPITNDGNNGEIVTTPLNDNRFRPLFDLLKDLTANDPESYTEERMRTMGFGELRDALLALDPLNGNHVKRVNRAEAEFWRLSEGYQVKPSDELLQFDCGGEQWVFEVCFPTGSYNKNNGNDMKFVEKLLFDIESKNIPAPAPIEQRWSASSSSLMSPAHDGRMDGLYSWVGVIMYLPLEMDDDDQKRNKVTDLFKGEYCGIVREVGRSFGAVSHWAKLEMPTTIDDSIQLKELVSCRYPVPKFNAARQKFDPNNILGNPLIHLAFGTTPPSSDNNDDLR